MASGGKLRKAVATIGLRRPPRSAVLFQKSSPMRVLFSYSSCSHVSPTIETDIARRGELVRPSVRLARNETDYEVGRHTRGSSVLWARA